MIFLIRKSLKSALISFALFFFAANLFSLEISVGGAVGSEVIQSYKTYYSSADYYPYPVLLARPNFSVFGDFEFEKFGIRPSFDFSISSSKISTSIANSELSESAFNLCLEPYFLWKIKKFGFALGPVIGVSFSTDSYDYVSVSGSSSHSSDFTAYFIYGASLDVKYDLTEHLSAFLTLPFLVNTGKGKSFGSSTSQIIYVGISGALYFVPKIGLGYTF